eukprot:768775-Hanusia_phi.AAC.4
MHGRERNLADYRLAFLLSDLILCTHLPRVFESNIDLCFHPEGWIFRPGKVVGSSRLGYNFQKIQGYGVARGTRVRGGAGDWREAAKPVIKLECLRARERHAGMKTCRQTCRQIDR